MPRKGAELPERGTGVCGLSCTITERKCCLLIPWTEFWHRVRKLVA